MCCLGDVIFSNALPNYLHALNWNMTACQMSQTNHTCYFLVHCGLSALLVGQMCQRRILRTFILHQFLRPGTYSSACALLLPFCILLIVQYLQGEDHSMYLKLYFCIYIKWNISYSYLKLDTAAMPLSWSRGFFPFIKLHNFLSDSCSCRDNEIYVNPIYWFYSVFRIYVISTLIPFSL